MLRKGTSRIVWLIPRFGIVVKLPIVRLRLFFRCLFHYLRSYEQLSMFFTDAVDIRHSARSYLFKGIMDNWREYTFFQRNKKAQFLLPTFFSLFGLFNISPLVEELKWNEDTDSMLGKLWGTLLDVTEKAVLKDGHHFSEAHNFCFYNGSLRMSDYGSTITQEIISKHLYSLNHLSESFQPK